VQTKHGNTREIKITDSIRQGGVLSVVEYALLMDEINKAIEKEDLGTFIDFLEEKIACLLWMDDVLLLTHNLDELKKMLEITHRIASKYHIEFGKDKSKLMIIGDQNIPHEIKIGDMNLDVCDMYKYLGMVINKLNNLTDQIKGIKGKTEITYQTILALTGNEEMNEIEIAASWELIENTIIPIITYVSETWNPTEKEIKELNTILDNILRRVLITPYTTPRESLYIETGLMEMPRFITYGIILLVRTWTIYQLKKLIIF
jgi:hypothetical protein